MRTGEIMKQRRKQLGLTADDVAAALGVSRSTVFRYEKGDIEKLPTDILDPLSKVLKTTPAYLMGWTDDPETSGVETKKPTLHLEDELDELDRKLLILLRRMTADQKKLLVAQLELLTKENQ